MVQENKKLEQTYREDDLVDAPEEMPRPDEALVEVVQGGLWKGRSVLDLDCGIGIDAAYLAQNGFEVTAMGGSKDEIEGARELVGPFEKKVRLIEIHGIELPLENESFDHAFDIGRFKGLDRYEMVRYLSEVHRVLKRTGTFLLLVPSYSNGPGDSNLTRQEIDDILGPLFDILTVDDSDRLEGEKGVVFYYIVNMTRR